MAELIKTDRLTKQFGEIRAVDGISLSVKKGEVLGFLGPNGAGKSTTMKMITGFLEPDQGVVRICGIGMADSPLEAKRRIGYLPEGAPAYADMTARSFLHFIAEVRGFVPVSTAGHVRILSRREGCGGPRSLTVRGTRFTVPPTSERLQPTPPHGRVGILVRAGLGSPVAVVCRRRSQKWMIEAMLFSAAVNA